MDFCFIASTIFLLTIIHEGCTKNCTHDIPHGEVTWWCSAFTGNMCPYSCDKGYEKNPDVSWISCSSSGEWRPFIRIHYMSAENLCLPKSCPQMIPNGKLSDACDATVGSTCDYSCNTGYQKNAGIISCETSTNWSRDPHLLCTNNQQCPYEIEDGDLDLSCRRIPGESCNYTCHEGYLPSETSTTMEIICESPSTWSKPLSSLCEKILCPTVIPHGRVSSDCSREYKKYCHTYKCDNGYTEPPAAPGLRCNASGQWDWNEHQGNPCTGPDELCPSNIKNGYIVWHCHRQHGATCTYDCNSGCTENRSVTWLNCENNSMWDKNTDTLCSCELGTTPSPNLCSYSIPNGHINRGCGRRPFEPCRYTCDDGCHKVYGALYCRRGSYWENENLACICNDGRKTSEMSAPTTTASTCPKTIPHGYISVTCSRVPSYRCDYACYDGCRKMYYSLLCKSSGSWSSGGYACLCPVTETTTSSSRGSNSIPITIGAMVGVVALFVIIFVCGYIRLKRKRQRRQRNCCSQPAIHYYPPTVTGTDFNGTPNRNVTSVYLPPTQTDLNTSTQLPPSSEENSYTQIQPPNIEQNIQNPKPPEYSSITQLDSRENPPPYELVMAYPADFRI